jgi:hypothetical protein
VTAAVTRRSRLSRSPDPPMKRVFLGGEGASELGGWSKERVYRSDEPGALEALARRVAEDGWQIVDAVCWKNIRKYQVGRSEHNDTDNVLGLVLAAEEAGCDVVMFSRDDDGEDATASAVAEGLQRARNEFDVTIVGGPSRPCIEGWVLALLGATRTESLGSARAKRDARARGLGGTADYVAAIESADIGPAPEFARLPADAETLRAWLTQAVDVLTDG